jgi:hypothetical protein
MTARTFVGHQRGLPMATSEDIILAIDRRSTSCSSTWDNTAGVQIAGSGLIRQGSLACSEWRSMNVQRSSRLAREEQENSRRRRRTPVGEVRCAGCL